MKADLVLPLISVAKACEFAIKAIESVGLVPGNDVSLALDIASTQFFDGSMYNLKTEEKSFNSDDYVNYINNLVTTQPIISIEDPFAEDDSVCLATIYGDCTNKIAGLGR
jgi:enolase